MLPQSSGGYLLTKTRNLATLNGNEYRRRLRTFLLARESRLSLNDISLSSRLKIGLVAHTCHACVRWGVSYRSSLFQTGAVRSDSRTKHPASFPTMSTRVVA